MRGCSKYARECEHTVRRGVVKDVDAAGAGLGLLPLFRLLLRLCPGAGRERVREREE
jgi:hypothetical protein